MLNYSLCYLDLKMFIFSLDMPFMIVINIFKCILQNWLNEMYVQQWQNETISKDLTRMKIGICVYKDRVPFMGKLL